MKVILEPSTLAPTPSEFEPLGAPTPTVPQRVERLQPSAQQRQQRAERDRMLQLATRGRRPASEKKAVRRSARPPAVCGVSNVRTA